MNNIRFVSAENIKTLEEYGAALLSSMISLRTLESFHIAAFKAGILEEEEEETTKTICWELRRIMILYKTMIEGILERTELNENTILTSLQMLMPDVKKPRKKKNKQDIENQ